MITQSIQHVKCSVAGDISYHLAASAHRPGVFLILNETTDTIVWEHEAVNMDEAITAAEYDGFEFGPGYELAV